MFVAVQNVAISFNQFVTPIALEVRPCPGVKWSPVVDNIAEYPMEVLCRLSGHTRVLHLHGSLLLPRDQRLVAGRSQHGVRL